MLMILDEFRSLKRLELDRVLGYRALGCCWGRATMEMKQQTARSLRIVRLASFIEKGPSTRPLGSDTFIIIFKFVF